ncbi:hypothetical protein GCM10027425_23360 [Alteromonas gracilis]
MSFSQRDQRRRARELERRMAELDRLDAMHGLGSWPPPQPPRRSRDRTAWLALLIVCVIGVGTLVVLPELMGRGERTRAEVMAGSTGPHVFLNTNADGSPVRYNPCRPIRYQINPANGPGDAEELVAEAVEEVSAATALGFEYAGTTRDRPAAVPGRVSIGWGSEAEFPRLAGRTIGLGGSMMQSTIGGSSYIGGSVVIESDREFFRDRGQHRAVLMHELAHVVGLGHVDDPRELMAAENSGQLWFGPGDIQGLAELGRGECLG